MISFETKPAVIWHRLKQDDHARRFISGKIGTQVKIEPLEKDGLQMEKRHRISRF
ncbi:hypothetical protein GGQ95_003163 [Anoxybacillus rupiensis]|nr:hypothetical protein [Anoxybacillus rupiensis]